MCLYNDLRQSPAHGRTAQFEIHASGFPAVRDRQPPAAQYQRGASERPWAQPMTRMMPMMRIKLCHKRLQCARRRTKVVPVASIDRLLFSWRASSTRVPSLRPEGSWPGDSTTGRRAEASSSRRLGRRSSTPRSRARSRRRHPALDFLPAHRAGGRSVCFGARAPSARAAFPPSPPAIVPDVPGCSCTSARGAGIDAGYSA